MELRRDSMIYFLLSPMHAARILWGLHKRRAWLEYNQDHPNIENMDRKSAISYTQARIRIRPVPNGAGWTRLPLQE